MKKISLAVVLACAVVFSMGQAVFAKPKPKPKPKAKDLIDVSKAKDRLEVVTDGSGHYVVMVPFARDEDTDLSFYGDGKDFWQLRRIGGGMSGTESFDFTYWEPRVDAMWKSSFGWKDQKYKVQCDDRETVMTPLDPSQAKAIIQGARFHKPRWQRMAYRLLRDDRGTYFYIDSAREGKKLFRVFIGPKGQLREIKLKNVVSDSKGEIFSTKNGELRLVLSGKELSPDDEMLWIKGETRTKLLDVPVDENHVMIYTELGPYDGQQLGTPCDDL